jgi:hypothetical protein
VPPSTSAAAPSPDRTTAFSPREFHSASTRGGIHGTPVPAQLFLWRTTKTCPQSEQAGPAIAGDAAIMDSVLAAVSTMPHEDELTNLRARRSSTKTLLRSPPPLFWPIPVGRSSLISQPSHTDGLGQTQISTAADAQVYSSRAHQSIGQLENASGPVFQKTPIASPKHLFSCLVHSTYSSTI